jgi:hypothetical protein
MILPTNYDALNQQAKKVAREQYSNMQGYLCYYCARQLSGPPAKHVTELFPVDLSYFPKGFLKNPVHLHHDHKTGMTEGAVHAYCNAVLWQYEGR